MTTAQDIYRFLDRKIPFSTQESWDNSGFLAGDPRQNVTRIITALDITGSVIDEAVSENAQLIISHHPVIFSPLKTVMRDTVAGRLLTENISAICTHTPFDMSPIGMNKGLYDILGNALLLHKSEPLEVTGEGLSVGMIYELDVQMPPKAVAQKAKDALGCRCVRYTNGRLIKKIAICSGSGGSMISLAKKKGADALISGDFKHDQLVDAGNDGFSVIDCGHYYTERIFSTIMAEIIGKEFPDITVTTAESCTDPAEYII